MSKKTPVSPRKKPTQARARATWNAIVDATAQVLVDEGFAKATTNRVAERAGVSVGTLYQYFPNKESLVLAVAERHAAEVLGTLVQMTGDLTQAPIREAVRGFVRAMLESHQHNVELHRTLVLQVLHLAHERITETQARGHQVLRAWLELRKDEIRPDDLDLAAWMLVSLVVSLVHFAEVTRPELLGSRALEDELVEMVCRYLLP